MNENKYLRDRSWMYVEKKLRATDVFYNGVIEFTKFAIQNRAPGDVEILCPCNECQNKRRYKKDEVEVHILKNGFVRDYKVWSLHGETSENHGNEVHQLYKHWNSSEKAQSERNIENHKKPKATPTPESIIIINKDHKMKKKLCKEHPPAKVWSETHNATDDDTVAFRIFRGRKDELAQMEARLQAQIHATIEAQVQATFNAQREEILQQEREIVQQKMQDQMRAQVRAMLEEQRETILQEFVEMFSGRRGESFSELIAKQRGET